MWGRRFISLVWRDCVLEIGPVVQGEGRVRARQPLGPIFSPAWDVGSLGTVGCPLVVAPRSWVSGLGTEGGGVKAIPRNGRLGDCTGPAQLEK